MWTGPQSEGVKENKLKQKLGRVDLTFIKYYVDWVRAIVENEESINTRYYNTALGGRFFRIENKIRDYAKALEGHLEQIGISHNDPNLVFLVNLQRFIGKSDPSVFLRWDKVECSQKKQQLVLFSKTNPSAEKMLLKCKDNNLHFVEGFANHVLHGGNVLGKKNRKGVRSNRQQIFWWLLPALVIYSELIFSKKEWAVLNHFLKSNRVYDLVGLPVPEHKDLEVWWDNNVREATSSKYKKMGLALGVRLSESIFLYKGYLEGQPYYTRQPNQFTGQEYFSPKLKSGSLKGKNLSRYLRVVSKNFKEFF